MVHQMSHRENPESRKGSSKAKDRYVQISHHLKCWPEFFELIKAGKKTHDLRRADDRDFQVGNRLLLEEFDPDRGAYTGRTLQVNVTYITSGELPCALSKEALHPDYCILSIKLVR